MDNGIVIAIDGTSSSGKGTLGRSIANHYGWHYLDTGLLYRTLARTLLTQGLTADNVSQVINLANSLKFTNLQAASPRDEHTGKIASQIALIPEVRQALLGFQRQFANRPPGAVLDGRDIGTVVCPHAPVKLFITAGVEIRARRRTKELRNNALKVEYPDILASLIARDTRDKTRKISALRPASDAVILDTSNLTIKQTFDQATEIISDRLPGL